MSQGAYESAKLCRACHDHETAIIVPRYLIKPRLEGRESAKRTTFAVVPECVWFLTAEVPIGETNLQDVPNILTLV